MRADAGRRGFLRAAAAAAAGVALPRAIRAEPRLALRLGYHAITWDGRDEQAIDEIAALGFHGIQLRANALQTYGECPAQLQRRLEQAGLALLCFSSGSVDAVAERESEYLETHLVHARFVHAVGGGMMQVTSRRPRDRAPTAAEFERLGRLLTEIGRRSADAGVRVVYHNHMGAFGEGPEEVARVLEVSDGRFVGLLLDIAHYRQGGGDPAAAVLRHRERLAMLHLKDVVSPAPGDRRPQSYRFVELGRGRVDVPGVIASLERIGFRGPAVIELDSVSDPARTPRECAAINKRYVVESLGLSL